MQKATGLPRYYDGTRVAITLRALDAAENQTVAALDAQTLIKVQIEQELQKIETWRAILARSAGKPKAP
jgi:hypothetical protein